MLVDVSRRAWLSWLSIWMLSAASCGGKLCVHLRRERCRFCDPTNEESTERQIEFNAVETPCKYALKSLGKVFQLNVVGLGILDSITVILKTILSE